MEIQPEAIYLEVKKSTIPNSGNGLFAAKDYFKGEKIAEYIGKRISEEEGEKKKGKAGDYLIDIDNGILLDTYDSQCLAGIANDAEGFVRIPGLSNNSEIIEYRDQTVWLVAKKYIPAGSEIFVEYGSDYWKNYIPPVNKFSNASAEIKDDDEYNYKPIIYSVIAATVLTLCILGAVIFSGKKTVNS